MANTSGTFNVYKSVASYSQTDPMGTYSGVNLWLMDDASGQFTPEEIESLAPGGTFSRTDEQGTETIYGYKSDPWTSKGRVLETVNPFGTQEMASNILRNMIYSTGVAFNYHGFEADALIPPHFEIGDAVAIDGNHHGIYNYSCEAGRLPKVTLSAPSDEEIDHEFPAPVDTKSREITRQFSSVRSQLSVQASEIAARVTRVGENDTKTFAWSLTENGFKIHNGEITATTTPLFLFDETGLHIKGEIEALSGKIGSFNIGSGIWSGKSTLSASTNGIYIGTDGISIGSYGGGPAFKVDSSGNLTAMSGKFGSISINQQGNTVGTYNGSLSGCGGTVTNLGGSVNNMGGNLSTGIKVGEQGIKTYVEEIAAGKITAKYISTQLASLESVSINRLNLLYQGTYKSIGFKQQSVVHSVTFASEYVGKTTISYLGW
ncbi:MAG: hypothetical protein HUJ67_02785 [Ruminiclostridium sp.]|nr:hypothetical protein [Ruminiclostridium sp.]